MTAAIFGLVGVIVGGLVTAGVDYWRTRRAERDEKKAAIRLVLLELTTLAELVGVAEESQVLGYGDALDRAEESLAAYLPVPPAWREHRRTLAKLLPAEDWTAVATAMQLFEVDPSWSRAMFEPQHSREDLQGAWARTRWDKFHGALDKATKVMERHAEIQWSTVAR